MINTSTEMELIERGYSSDDIKEMSQDEADYILNANKIADLCGYCSVALL